MHRHDIEEAFMRRVERVLWEQGKSSVSEVADALDADRERTRLALRELFRLGRVADCADFEYRLTYPVQAHVKES